MTSTADVGCSDEGSDADSEAEVGLETSDISKSGHIAPIFLHWRVHLFKWVRSVSRRGFPQNRRNSTPSTIIRPAGTTDGGSARQIVPNVLKRKACFFLSALLSVDPMNAGFPVRHPFPVPIYPAGKEPLPPGFTEEDRTALEQSKKWEKYMAMGMESCIVKTVAAGGAGFGLGAFFSLMSASFAYEDPYLRQQTQAGLNAGQKAREVLKDMGKGMWKSGKGFGKVGALFAGIECVIESYRAKNDIINSVASGFIAGGVLARNSGPKAAFGGGLAFAAFSAAIDMLFLRRETPDED